MNSHNASEDMGAALHMAAVYAHDGIRLLTAARSAEAVNERIASYVERQAEVLLWPADARRVRALLEVGERKEAIALYFARVGDRWEREHLHREEIATGRSNASRAATSHLSLQEDHDYRA